jgi:hypothetical protein
LTWLLLWGLVGPGTLSGQTVLSNPPPLDSARLGLRDALTGLRDSLLTVNGAAARLQRDIRQASAASLLSRARVMRDACAGSARTVEPTRKVLLATPLPEPDHVKARRELLQAMGRLETALTRCQSQFAAMSEEDQAETVRGYSYERSGRVQRALQNYEARVRHFLDLVGIQLPGPPGAGEAASG